MKFDFENVINRSGLGSSKWNEMKKINPDVPENIVPLSVADMELKNAPRIMEGIRAFLDAEKVTLGYTSPTESYNEAVRSWMKKRHSWEVDMKWNVPTPGVVTAFFHAIRAYSQPGDGVIIFTPVYYPFKMAIERNNRTVADVPLVNRGLRYEIDWDRFEAAARERSNKLLLFCSPHNPVGRVWTEEELRRVSDICLKYNVLVLSDEIHNDLIMPGYKHTVYATLSEDALQNCLIFTSPSKTFNLAGLQTSNILIPNEKLRERFIETMLDSGLVSVNIIGYKACEIAYTQCEEWLTQAIGLIAQNAKLVEDYMKENIPQIKVHPLEGTYLQWWDCRELFDDYREMEDFMQNKAYLFLDEGYLFGENGQGFERINLACPPHILYDALQRLKTALESSAI
ncbi:MAG: pyridoxal phosphate-dependent aminotransferase [Clostridiales bacterium]|jgi:cystathionine beta-lyase|nr:pyridoxal phosphate-dependent aminotransferase [Clostridiales bacterium]